MKVKVGAVIRPKISRGWGLSRRNLKFEGMILKSMSRSTHDIYSLQNTILRVATAKGSDTVAEYTHSEMV